MKHYKRSDMTLDDLESFLAAGEVLPCPQPKCCPFGKKPRKYRCLLSAVCWGSDKDTGERIPLVRCSVAGYMYELLEAQTPEEIRKGDQK